MTPDAFRESARLGEALPTGLSGPLQALWWAARGDWEQAHAAAQAGEDAASAWVHAYLHRIEGDLGNADYWYRRAGRRRPAEGLEAEWAAIATALLREGPPR
ncbi:hypothetical protein [Roseicella frigidaeris]|uniref:DUF309 domain-containing protein n=1 Tax=Roseicella frigidaeris TaxID=2230885 RepID=A0A327MA13_9PROT|nr:hypothetical protein [Roseicella frigidaeris]RAI58994.1 hypothetical protein DOO78_10640 [Roseicella frigidaeris]